MSLSDWTCALALGAALFTAGPSAAQTITGTPGAPDAKTTINGLQIPAPPQEFHGKIERNAAQSTPFWPATVAPAEGSPNVLLILLDDAGYGSNSTFGGVIPTPTLDKLAEDGLRYTNLNSAALCSPTRAALITGRNHHSMGFGVIAEQATGFPGYNSLMSKDRATIARILTENGYRTGWWGKNHNTPAFQVSQNGPFDQWPTGMGFDYFYGFNGGDTSQWQPGPLFRNTTPIYPYVGHPGYNLITDMADDAISWIDQTETLSPGQPFFIYYAPGATHAPHHPTKEWVDKISAMHLFDDGWNKLRETIFANQKRLGVIPGNADLTAWPDDLLKTWDQLSADEKKMFVRQADVYAAYLAYTDHEVGRVIQKIEDIGERDNTLIIYITGDNGSSAEGTPIGTPNEVAAFNGVDVPVDVQLKDFYDVWGTDQTYNHMAVGWTWAFDTPFKWTKQIAGYFGGTRQGTVVSWPAKITDKGGIRTQFTHVIDVVPTILEAIGVSQPSVVDGIAQSPIEGTSFAYTFDAARADEPSHHRTQYFEMMGEYALYHEDWIASTKVTRPPWEIYGAANLDPANSEWELFDLASDPTQAHDVAAANPAKLKELQLLFWEEAEKYQVLPLDASVATRLISPRPSLTAGRTQFVWDGPLTGTPNGDAPSVLNTSYTITAEVEVPEGGGDGMIITQGGRFGGYGFYLKGGKPVVLWNLVDLDRIRWEGAEALTAGKHTLEFDFKYDGLGFATLAFNQLSGIGQAGTGMLKVDGKVVAEKKMEKTVPLILQWDENLDVGADTGTPVDDADYQIPFTFTGTLDKVTLSIDHPVLTDADKATLEAAMKKKAADE